MKHLLLLTLFAFTLARATAAEPAASIDTAIAKGDTAEVQRLLTAQPELVRTPGAGKMLPLHQAILRKKSDIVALLLERGADINAPDPSLRTPLHLAVERSDAALVKALLARRASQQLLALRQRRWRYTEERGKSRRDVFHAHGFLINAF